MEKDFLPDSPGVKSERPSTASGPASGLKITAIHPKVMDALEETITEARARKLSVGIFCGVRTAEEQERLWDLGRVSINPDGASIQKPKGDIVTNARAWESWHNFGLAADLVFKTEKGNWTWDVDKEKWTELGVVGELFGLEWGGTWRNVDYPHFQMRGGIVSIAQARNVLFNDGLEKLWAMV